MNSPIKWHGGKHYLASKIVEIMKSFPHKVYVEPFFGGGSVLFHKDFEGISETVNDLDHSLVNFWQVLADKVYFDEFKRMVEAIPVCESNFYDIAKPCSMYPPEMAAWLFVRCRQSLGGRKKSFQPPSIRVRRGMNELVSAWLTSVEGLQGVHERLKRVLILNREALSVIGNLDSENTLFYLDPPYVKETRVAQEVYVCEMLESDHIKLLEAIKLCKGVVLLSGYRSEVYDNALSGWSRVDRELPNNAAGGDKKRRMTECIWINRRYPA